ncbi:MAG: hypothetical protein ACHREM_18090 [Polyangiales bacterium]
MRSTERLAPASTAVAIAIAIATTSTSCASRKPQDVDHELQAFAIADCSTDAGTSCTLDGNASPLALFSGSGTSGVVLREGGTLDATFAQPGTPSTLAYLAIGLEWYVDPTVASPPAPVLEMWLDGQPITSVTPTGNPARLEIDMHAATISPTAKVHLVAHAGNFIVAYVAGRWNDL